MCSKTLLYVEDEENDVLLLQLGLQRAGLRYRLQTVQDGQQALAYLSGTGLYTDRQQYPLPNLVLLDLNLPCLSGMKVLEWIREQPQFATLPVVMYTSSDHPTDIANARQLGVTDYVLKPSRLSKIAEVVQRLTHQWLEPAAQAA
jgi:CheY-like chemotaxis protein